MLWTDYYREVFADSVEYIQSEIGPNVTNEEMADWLFTADSVTGNGSGSYTFSTAQAAENVAGWIFDDEAQDAFREFGYDEIPISKGPEALDVIARCWWLGQMGLELEKVCEFWRTH